MGVNTLGMLMKSACQRAGISGKKTNHSLRKSAVTELSAAGVPPHKIIKITGHRQSSSIQHYDNSMSIEEHRHISSILCGNDNSNKASKKAGSSAPPSRKRPLPRSEDHPILASLLKEPGQSQQVSSQSNIENNDNSSLSENLPNFVRNQTDELSLWARDMRANYRKRHCNNNLSSGQLTNDGNAEESHNQQSLENFAFNNFSSANPDLFRNNVFKNCTFNFNFSG